MTAGTKPSTHWDARYQDADPAHTAPARVLKQNTHLLSEPKLALDLACGMGGNSIYLAEAGWQVDAIDYSAVACQKLADYAVKRGLSISPIVRNLEAEGLANQQYDLIVVSYYLFRPLLPLLAQHLKKGGLLFYQTWTVEKTTDRGPSNPEFLLQPNELLAAFEGCRVLHYEEPGLVGDHSSGFRGEASIVVVK